MEDAISLGLLDLPEAMLQEVVMRLGLRER
jgi:hypothetical protein